MQFEGNEGMSRADALDQWFSTWGSCAPQGNPGHATGIWWVQAKDAAKHPVMSHHEELIVLRLEKKPFQGMGALIERS